MKALTIHQPYAELIVSGEKLVENRTWYTSFRGPLLIHAGKSHEWLDGADPAKFVMGALVGIAQVMDCVRFNPMANEAVTCLDKYPFLVEHIHAHGPYCWILDEAERINPIPYRGAQGLFDVPDEVIAEYLNKENK